MSEGGEPSALATPGLILLSYTTPWDAALGALAVLQVWISTALDLGATSEDPPRQEPFGAEAWLLDPEGNRLLLLVLPAK
jgi:hypothetical protein